MRNYYYEPINVKQWNYFDVVKNIGHVEQFLATKQMEIGDIIFLHIGSQDSNYESGIYALAEIISEPYIYKGDPSDKCYNNLSVDTKIIYMDKVNPLVNHKDLLDLIPTFRSVCFIPDGEKIYEIIMNKGKTIKLNKNYEEENKKRVKEKKQWLKVLNNENQENNMALNALLYLYDCKNYTSNGKAIASFFNTDVAAINSYVKSFGKRVIDLLGLEEQKREDGSNRRWNIPFETVPEMNNSNLFTWKLRKELVDALVEKYDLVPKDSESIDEKIHQFVEEYPYDEYCKSIEGDLKAREDFVNRFTLNKIQSMSIDEFVIGRADIAEDGRDSFCYILERKMQHLGQMRGSFVQKFGVWYSKDEHIYDNTKKYGDTVEEAFENLKKDICMLLVSANNNDYETIEKCKIADLFKGKIISTYYPDKYLCIFDKNDVDKFLNLLDIKYDIHEVDTLEKKKDLLVRFKDNNPILNNYSDYYFVLFLYKTFKNEVKIENTVAGAIDYDIDYVDFEYLKNHEFQRKNIYRSRDTDYERINRNKKDIGNRGEEAIKQSEISKLKKMGYNDLSEQVRICDNDAIGYDVISYDENGKEIHIEVKTNSGNKSYLDFYITDNELQHLIEEDNYYIYYLFNIKGKGKPKCHIINKKQLLRNNKELFQPVIYKVNVDVLEK